MLKEKNRRLVIHPRKVYKTFENFVEDRSIRPYSIAVDGIVESQTEKYKGKDGPYANYDHHDRGPEVRASCAQIYMDILRGYFEEEFKPDGTIQIDMHINDLDEDTLLSWWLLENYEKVLLSKDSEIEERIIDLVTLEDFMDSTGGTLAIPERKAEQLDWVFEEYNKSREAVTDMDRQQMEMLVPKVTGRISRYVDGKAERLQYEGEYRIEEHGENWTIVKEVRDGKTEGNPKARRAICRAGIRDFATIIGERENGSLVYSLFFSQIREDDEVRKVYQAINQKEKDKGTHVTESNKWGGSNTGGGSPRQTGSFLTPEELLSALEDC